MTPIADSRIARKLSTPPRTSGESARMSPTSPTGPPSAANTRPQTGWPFNVTTRLNKAAPIAMNATAPNRAGGKSVYLFCELIVTGVSQLSAVRVPGIR